MEKKKKGYWTKERCYEFALTCTSSMDMHRKSSGAYDAAVRNKWIKDYTWFEKKDHDSEDYVIYAYEDIDNKVVYVGLTFDMNGRNNCHRSKKKGGDVLYKYYKSISKEMPKPIIKMDGLNAVEAQFYEDWYRNAYDKLGWTVLNIAKTGEGVSSLGYNIPKLTYEVCREIASQYKTKKEFREANQSAYQKSVRKKWINDFGFKDTHEVLCENSPNAIKVRAYDKNGDFVGEWSSMKKAEEDTGAHGIKTAIDNPNRYRCGKYYWFKCPITDNEAKEKVIEMQNKFKESFRKGHQNRKKVG